jgi:hypothetical protein
MTKGDKYLCNSREWNCYIKGNIYVVEDVKSNSIGFINENNQLHYVSYEDLLTDFSNLQQVNDIKVNYEIVKPKNDSIVSSVMFQLAQRSILGQQKYGTTLQENNNDDFLQHLKEELMDAILYIEKLQTLKNIMK